MPRTDHPRLWLNTTTLPELRARATAANPLYKDGLAKVAAESMRLMDLPSGGIIAKDGGSWAESYPECSELHAQVFGLMCLVAPDAERADYGKRAKTLLMNVIDKVYSGLQALPPATTLADMAPGGALYNKKPWVGGDFALQLRTFVADSIPLTVDWIYPLLSAADKAKIRTVFLYWSRLICERAATTGDADRPQPAGVFNDPKLLDLADPNRRKARFAGNNWFAMHMRMLGMMSLAMDAADDVPGAATGGALFSSLVTAKAGALRGYQKDATGRWLYMVHAFHAADGRGGMSPEGMQYFGSGLAPTAQFLLALKTAGHDAPLGPFWRDLLPAFLSAMSPVGATIKGSEYLGPEFLPVAYGDMQKKAFGDLTGLFGILARLFDLSGDTARGDVARWIAANASPGGATDVAARAAKAINNSSTRTAIATFLAFESAALPADPRPKGPSATFAAGINYLSSRTGNDASASWLTFFLPWIRVDHQHGEADMLQWWRGSAKHPGEWLTAKWTGYGPESACSHWSNTITVQNDPMVGADPGGYQDIQGKAGSQLPYINDGDPLLVGWSDAAEYTYAYGDATNLYNSTRRKATSVAHVSRSIVWLKPDHLVIYDRVISKKDGRFMRFWLNFENEPKIAGQLVTGATKGGQQLFVRTLLPTNATVAVKTDRPMGSGKDETAEGETMAHRLMVEALTGQSARFLHVLQGADAGAVAEPAVLVRSKGGTAYEGAIVADTAVMFPRDFGEPAVSLTYEVPPSVKAHVITGVVPGGGYIVSVGKLDGKHVVSFALGGAVKADAGGVLAFDGAGKAAVLGATAQGGAASLEAIRAAAAGLPVPVEPPPVTPPVEPPDTDPPPTPPVAVAGMACPWCGAALKVVKA